MPIGEKDLRNKFSKGQVETPSTLLSLPGYKAVSSWIVTDHWQDYYRRKKELERFSPVPRTSSPIMNHGNLQRLNLVCLSGRRSMQNLVLRSLFKESRDESSFQLDWARNCTDNVNLQLPALYILCLLIWSVVWFFSWNVFWRCKDLTTAQSTSGNLLWRHPMGKWKRCKGKMESLKWGREEWIQQTLRPLH